MERADRRLPEWDRFGSQTSAGTGAKRESSKDSGYREKHGFQIESLALPGEDPAELRALLDQWYSAYEPGGPAECHLVEMAVYDLIQIRRCRRCLEAVEEKLIVDTRNGWLLEQEAEVKKFRAMLASDPAAAVAELKRFASGCAWLAACWQRLESLVDREGARSDDNSEELAVFGMDDANHQVLSREETDYLTRVYCLLAQGDPTQPEILALYLASSEFPGVGELPSSGRLPPRWQCRRRVRAAIARELPPLRILYEERRLGYDQPAQEVAVNEALLRDPKRASVLRAQRQCEKSFHANYKLLLEIRKDFGASFGALGVPVPADSRQRRAPGKRPRAGG